jgi:hypothetical protein
MPAINKRNSVIVLGVLFIIVIIIGASKGPKKEPFDDVKVSFTESELDDLGKSIEDLEFDDLGSLSISETGEISEDELDNLGEAIKSLEFDDLAGLSDN